MSFLGGNEIYKNNSILYYYLPFTRFWEFIVGFFLAYLELKHPKNYKTSTSFYMTKLGLLCIIGSIILYQSSEIPTVLESLVPVTGTALIIHFITKQDSLNYFLKSRIFVGMGLISYSAFYGIFNNCLR